MGALDVKIDATDLSDLFRTLRAMDGDFQIALRRAVKSGAQNMVSAVKAEAAWSSRIPKSVKVKSSFAAKGASVSVYVDPKVAPEAAPLNNGGSGGRFRHPVFADVKNEVRRGWTWVDQNARPFFDVPTQREGTNTQNLIAKEVDAVLAKAGIK
jgi:hypothetical protein